MKNFHGMQSEFGGGTVRPAAEHGPGHFRSANAAMLAVIGRGFRAVERCTGETVGERHQHFRGIVADQADRGVEVVWITQLQDAFCAVDDQGGLLFVDSFSVEMKGACRAAFEQQRAGIKIVIRCFPGRSVIAGPQDADKRRSR